MPLPKSLRSPVPQRLKDSPRARAIALSLGLIPPRTMHTDAEACLLAQLARGAGRVVEIGVYEGSSALVFCAAMARTAELHLIDPFTDETGSALLPGARATPFATRRAVARGCADGPQIRWHVARSQDVGASWRDGPVDLVFVDGDHSERGCREDWAAWQRHVMPGGYVAFHDARHAAADGRGSVTVTLVVDDLFRSHTQPGWRISNELESLVVVTRDPR